MRLTRIELCDLLTQMTNVLRTYPEGSVEHQAVIKPPTLTPHSVNYQRLSRVDRRGPHAD